ncbi:DUF952 domain-containing protein [Microbaculum sp. FT89]|uniref:DUF952 domain-containing protein n=1 Tax=Microbaculum sp. FT89 TaxID=3447298 RepID=UPI003F535548
MTGTVFKICGRDEWRLAENAGVYSGNADDARDGFIHLSAADQIAGTLARHYAGRDDLLIVSVDASALGDALKWEPSRGGALFPHLYGHLPLAAVTEVAAIAAPDDGSGA